MVFRTVYICEQGFDIQPKRRLQAEETVTKMGSSSVRAEISFIALIAIGFIISGSDAYRPRRFIGGEDATPHEFPWMVRLNVTDKNGVHHDCGGAIISPRHILTAGHCLDSLTVNGVWTGSYIRDFDIDFAKSIVLPQYDWRSEDGLELSSDVKSNPAQIIVHPQYKWISENGWAYIENDVGIVVLDGDLKLDVNRNIIPLTNQETTVGTRATLSSWGFTDFSLKNRATVLQKSHVDIVPIDQCPIHLSELLCSRPPPHGGSCNGDSGSPLVADNQLVGILSTSYCSLGREVMFVSVFHHLAWITSTIENSSV